MLFVLVAVLSVAIVGVVDDVVVAVYVIVNEIFVDVVVAFDVVVVVVAGGFCCGCGCSNFHRNTFGAILVDLGTHFGRFWVFLRVLLGTLLGPLNAPGNQ